MPLGLLGAAGIGLGSSLLGGLFGGSKQETTSQMRQFTPQEQELYNLILGNMKGMAGNLGQGTDVNALTSSIFAPMEKNIKQGGRENLGQLEIMAGAKGTGPSSIFKSDQRKVQRSTDESLSSANTQARLTAEQVASAETQRKAQLMSLLNSMFGSMNQSRMGYGQTTTMPFDWGGNISGLGGTIAGFGLMENLLKKTG